MTTYYLARYALTAGIEEVDGDLPSQYGLVAVRGRGYQRLGKDLFLERDQAIARARQLRDANIRSARAQLARLVNMDFE